MRILVASSIDKEAIEKMSRQHDVRCAINVNEDLLKSHIRECDILIFRSGVAITADVLSCAKSLKLIVRAGSGIDNVDLEYLNKHNIQLQRIPEPGAQAVAEMTFALMLVLARQILIADHLLRQGRWAKHELKGYLLRGKTLGVLGVGNIGTRVGQLGLGLGMKVIGSVENPSQKRKKAFLQKGFDLVSRAEILKKTDYLAIHVPLKKSTVNLISGEELNQMKTGSFLINLSRGGVVDENALHNVLISKGGLAGAAMDVHKEEGEGKISPLAKLPNVILTPHIGATTIDSQREIGRRIIKIIENWNSVREPSALLK